MAYEPNLYSYNGYKFIVTLSYGDSLTLYFNIVRIV